MSKGGNKGGGGTTTQTIQNADPWSGVQPYLSNLYRNADQWLGSSSPSFYPGNTVADQSVNTLQALTRGAYRAGTGSPLDRMADQHNLETTHGDFLFSNPANGLLRDTANGAFLNKNPHLDAMFNSATQPMVNQYQRAVLPGIASQFSAAGRFGSGLQSQAMADAAQPLGQALSSAASSIYGGAYENERNRQQDAAKAYGANYNFERSAQEGATQLAPSLAANDYNDIEKLMSIGQYHEGRAQDLINANMQRWDFNQNQPLAKLQAYNALLQGGTQFGSTSTSQKASQARNPFLGAVGGAFAGDALGGALGSAMGGAGFGPIGMGIGALLGGLYG